MTFRGPLRPARRCIAGVRSLRGALHLLRRRIAFQGAAQQRRLMAQDGVARRDDARPASLSGLDEPDDADPPFRRAGLHLFAGRTFFKGVSDLAEYATELTVVSLDAGQDTRAEWAAARARHHPYGSRARRGRAEGTLRAIGTAQALTLRCQVDGALVHMQAARRRARAEGRDKYEAGDGCCSRRCSRNFRPAQFLRGQVSMADGLEHGARFLIEWPIGLGAREVSVLPARTAVEAATTARAAAPTLTCPFPSLSFSRVPPPPPDREVVPSTPSNRKVAAPGRKAASIARSSCPRS